MVWGLVERGLVDGGGGGLNKEAKRRDGVAAAPVV